MSNVAIRPCRNLRAKSADLETSLFQRVARHMTRQHFDIPHDSAFFIAIGGFGGERCWAKQAGRVPREIEREDAAHVDVLVSDRR